MGRADDVGYSRWSDGTQELWAKEVDVMNDPRLIMLAVLVVVVAAVVVGVWVLVKSKRRARLREQFGPEYPVAVEKYGSVTRAESALEARAARVRRLDIRPLPPPEAARYAASWRTLQARFVDDPRSAIAEADTLVQELMHTRGFAVGDFEQRVADISVDHASVVEHYRTAHAITLASERGKTTTEDLRQAVRHYRALFEDLLEVQPEAPRRMEAGR
jgi:hypothetical protein